MPESPSLATEDLSARLLAGLSKIGTVLKSQAWQAAGPRGLTPTQGQILTLLRSRAGAGGLRLSQVAAGLGVTPATASDTVSSLIAKGLVEKGRAADDARAKAIRLTPAGEAKADGLAGWPGFMIEAVETLTGPEQEVFLLALLKLIRALQEQGRVPVSRMCVGCRYFEPLAHPGAERAHHCHLLGTAIGTRELKLECPDQAPDSPEAERRHWERLAGVV